MRTFVIAYDIRSVKRLQRVHKLLQQSALPIEYSVFIFKGTPEACRQLLQKTLALLDLSKDDLRCYALPAHGRNFRVGRPALPEGIIWSGFFNP